MEKRKRVRSNAVNEDYFKELCRDCGGVKEYGYRKSCRCSACTALIRKSKRTYEKKSPNGAGRKPTCSTCGKLKELGRENESRCKACKADKYKANRAEKRIEMGLRPLGSGRKETCCKCGGVKENIEYGYCAKCDAIMKKLRRDKKVATEEGRIQEREIYRAKIQDPIFKLKKTARAVVNKYVALGKLEKQVCEVCSEEKTEAHHDDYMKPLEVRWLCKKHHAEHHKNEKEN